MKLHHPTSDDLAFLYGTILTDGKDNYSSEATANICVFAEAQVSHWSRSKKVRQAVWFIILLTWPLHVRRWTEALLVLVSRPELLSSITKVSSSWTRAGRFRAEALDHSSQGKLSRYPSFLPPSSFRYLISDAVRLGKDLFDIFWVYIYLNYMFDSFVFLFRRPSVETSRLWWWKLPAELFIPEFRALCRSRMTNWHMVFCWSEPRFLYIFNLYMKMIWSIINCVKVNCTNIFCWFSL